ncbi:hypothetical protein A5721_15860 [Mycobacterium vulneris]|nr:hypothetical protein A5721_15860 [Mycolicibacterium vulneris]
MDHQVINSELRRLLEIYLHNGAPKPEARCTMAKEQAGEELDSNLPLEGDTTTAGRVGAHPRLKLIHPVLQPNSVSRNLHRYPL